MEKNFFNLFYVIFKFFKHIFFHIFSKRKKTKRKKTEEKQLSLIKMTYLFNVGMEAVSYYCRPKNKDISYKLYF